MIKSAISHNKSTFRCTRLEKLIRVIEVVTTIAAR